MNKARIASIIYWMGVGLVMLLGSLMGPNGPDTPADFLMIAGMALAWPLIVFCSVVLPLIDSW
jgi:hypothetical protein